MKQAKQATSLDRAEGTTINQLFCFTLEETAQRFPRNILRSMWRTYELLWLGLPSVGCQTNPGLRRVIDGKTARQFIAMRVEAIRDLMRLSRAAPSSPTLLGLRHEISFNQAATFNPTDSAKHQAERLACLPSIKANRVKSPVGRLPDFCMRESCRTMPLVGGFSRGSPVSPVLSFRRCNILTLISFIGSQDFDVKSRPNLFTHSDWLQRDSCLVG
ncbi:hypothetical protein PR048_006873 [Dryococelus australis]|uniref:Uncharacterized protein n=1 Tax=Dryococelus australis TaxID=614101 RepID=A0ABQ9ID52_9NEOP|nr:hypothetical protein PR048_006873 [Dryococelus australis]